MDKDKILKINRNQFIPTLIFIIFVIIFSILAIFLNSLFLIAVLVSALWFILFLILNITNINDNVIKKVGDGKENIKKIYIRIPKDKFDLEDRVIGYIKELSKEYHGDNEVYIFYDGTNKLRLLNKKDFLVDSNEVIEKLVLAFGKENVKIK